MTFDNMTVLVTGASSGIGNAIVKELSKESCNLILVSRRMKLLEQLKKECILADDRCLTIQCDVAKKEEVAAASKLAKQKFGAVDIAVLNAGAGHTVTVENFDSRYAESTFGANLYGIIYWVEQLLPDFLEKKNGMIVGVSSLADNRGFSGSGFYCASKAAASIYLEGLRVELKPHNVKVITVKPGFVKTPMTDQNKFKMPFLMPAEKAAKIILAGIKKEKRVVQFPLPMVWLTRLVGFLPGGLYEWLAAKTKVQ